MIDEKVGLVRRALEAGTGADVSLRADRSGLQTSLQIWFTDLTRRGGPVVTLGPSGLRRHRVVIKFGSASAKVLTQIRLADDEAKKLACALTASIDSQIEVVLPDGMTRQRWTVNGPDFFISAEKRGIDTPLDDDEIGLTCEEIVVPLLAALAELIGYDEIAPQLTEDDIGATEGRILLSEVRRRERNPRNRLLAIRLHGHRCAICGLDPWGTNCFARHGIFGEKITPLASLDTPRIYDPASDLIPLCPTCHRVVHTRRPIPWEPREVLEMIANAQT
jgi:5-methylcytosine-specific restriction enzyme A